MSPRDIALQLGNGGQVDDVAAAYGVTRKAVMDAGFDHGLRYLDSKDSFTMTDKARTILGTPSVIAQGLACPDPKVKRAAEKAKTAMDNLRDLLATWEDRAAARADVERLEQELAKARARLRGEPTPKAKTGGTQSSNADIRYWAAANGVPCPVHGRIPNAVREAYDQAHRAAS